MFLRMENMDMKTLRQCHKEVDRFEKSPQSIYF